MTIGYDKPLYVLRFDHRSTFSKKTLSPRPTAPVATRWAASSWAAGKMTRRCGSG
jgi:hypothetical protein